VELYLDGAMLLARVGEVEIGQVEPRIGSRLAKLMKGGNRYEAAITCWRWWAMSRSVRLSPGSAVGS
jgi:hypothetical protein